MPIKIEPQGSTGWVAHTHDDRYYTEAECDVLFQPKSDNPTFNSVNISYTWGGSDIPFKVNNDGGYGIYVSDQSSLNYGYGKDADDDGWINYAGYGAGATRFRNLIFGDGKHNEMARFTGSTKALTLQTPLAITSGGTGQITATAAFDALSPMTTLGDIIYGGASGTRTRLAIGASGTVLHGGTTPSYSAVIETDLGLTDITTANTSGTKHGFAPRLSSNSAQFLDGTGNWSTPSAGTTNDYSATSFTSQTSINVTHNFGNYPVVQAIDNAGAQLISYSVTHNTVNDFTVTFTSAKTGTIIATMGSPQPMSYRAVTANTVSTTADRIIEVTASGKTITLYTAVGNTGREIIVDNSSSGDITVNCTGAETLEGETTQTIPSDSAVNCFSSGSVWRLY